MNDRASSGVRNLRAMFENPGAASSPEPRGRSPAGNAANDTPNRPTSKVRASFVSVEPSGHIAKDLGTTKGISVNSPQAQRRESFSFSDDLGEDGPAELKRVISEEKEKRKESELIPETIPEQAVETRESSRAPPPIRKAPDEMPNLGSIMKGSDFPEPEVEQRRIDESATPAVAKKPAPAKVEKPTEPVSVDTPADNPDKVVSGAQEEVSLKPADPKDEAAVSGGQALPPPTEDLHPASSKEPVPGTPKATPSKPKANGTTATPGKTPVKKPAAISTAKASATKSTTAKSPLPKSPAVARVPKTPTTPKPAPAVSAAVKSPAPSKAQPKPQLKPAAPKEATKAPAPKASRTSLRPSTATTATTASAAAKTKVSAADTKKPAAPKPANSAATNKEGTTTSPGGFKKPAPRPPTQPVRLPSHLTAPTASSAAKHGDDAAAQKLARKPSTASRPAPKPAPAARKQPSRASLAPSTTSTKRPESRASTKGGADEGFLARMMRPTASSASKTLDKPASPPRRGPSVKAPSKPKGHESVITKGKKKVEEVASKAKEAVTNGHTEGKATNGETAGTEHAAEPSHDAETMEPASRNEVVEEPVREATPVEQVESSAVELQTPNFEGQAIR